MDNPNELSLKMEKWRLAPFLFLFPLNFENRIWIILINPHWKWKSEGRRPPYFLFPLNFENRIWIIPMNPHWKWKSEGRRLPYFCFHSILKTGFEPATTRPPAVYATGLRHIPILKFARYSWIIFRIFTLKMNLLWSSLSWALTKGHIPKMRLQK